TGSSKNEDFYNSGEIKKIHDFIQQNFGNRIKVKDMAEMLNMTVVSFSRFIKKRTGKTFVEFLNDMRLGFAARWLLETDMQVAEIAFKCGFNNLGYFNRVFKKAKGCTPIEFKENFIGIKKFS
ncbi:MAG: AraC family transcriptional regulator, partial [Bacteroidota bacterium]|nr:AraC family transcriptional regulator [Bacteroidota bacterium]